MQNSPHSAYASSTSDHRAPPIPKCHQLSPNAVLLTYHDGEIGRSLEEHFSRSLTKLPHKNVPASSFPPSYWHKQYSRRMPPPPPPLQARYPSQQHSNYGAPPPPLLRPGGSWAPMPQTAPRPEHMSPTWPSRYPASSYPTLLDIGQRCSGAGYGSTSGFRPDWSSGFAPSVDAFQSSGTVPPPGYSSFATGLDCSIPVSQDCFLPNNTWSNFI